MPGLGLRLDRKWDVRNANFLLREVTATDESQLPNHARWLSRTKAFDQGDTGTCVGNTGEAFLIYPPIVQKRAGAKPSRWDLYRACVAVDQWPDNDHEASLPDGDPGLAFGTSTLALMRSLKTMGYIGSYRWALDVQTISQFLRMQGANFAGRLGGPVVVGTAWYDSMFTPSAENILQITPNARVAGGHEWLVIGANRQRGMLEMLNSWGPGWGRNGRAFIAMETMHRLLTENGDAVTTNELKLVA
jgi:hypothetical protein